MYNRFRKVSALLLASAMFISAVSCSSKEDEHHDHQLVSSPDEGVNVNEEDLEYGATMVSLRPDTDENVKVEIEFDRRYFNMENENDYPEIYLISNYIEAVNNKNGDIMQDIFYLPYLNYNCGKNGFSSIQEYTDSVYEGLKSSIGSDFVLDYVIVDTCLNENEDDSITNFSAIDNQLDMISGEKLSSKVTSRKAVYLDIMYTDESGSEKQLNNAIGYDISLYIYQIDGNYYLI